MRVALFVTCVNDLLFSKTGQAVVRILERLGHQVDFPAEQTCCGQMHANTGYRDEAAALARRFARTFEPYEVVVTPSGSCAAMVREAYPRLIGGQPPPIYELSELLVDVLGVTDLGARFPHRVTYHPTCHGLRMLRLGDRPQRLLRKVRDLELVELPGAQECCGFGGTFALKNSDVSAAMLADKCTAIRGTGAEYVTAADNSCLLHIAGGLARQPPGNATATRRAVAPAAVKAIHYAEILGHE